MNKIKINYLLIFLCTFLIYSSNGQIKGEFTEDKGRFGVHSFRAKELDIAQLNVIYIRQAIPWALIETEDGKFSWETKEFKRIDALLEEGFLFIPVIRTSGHFATRPIPERYASFHPSHRPSSPPNDLQKTFHKDYGYSKSYYRFVSELARHYKGKIPIVVIENEVTADLFWSGSMEEYLRLVATARKAFKDVDPNVRIADSGIPSQVWGHLIAKDLLEQEREKEALDFFKSYYEQSFVSSSQKVNSIQDLKNFLQEDFIKETIEEAEYLLKRLNGAVDIVNFHYYEAPKHFQQVISFIKKRVGNMPLMNNELGTRHRFDVPEREKNAAEDTIKKFTLCLASNLEAAIWFPFTNERHYIIGLFDENKRKIEITTNAFQVCMRFLNRTVLSYQNLSSDEIERYSFTFSSEKVDVAWSAREKIINLTEGCLVFNFQGQEIKDNKVILSPSPVFIVSKIIK